MPEQALSLKILDLTQYIAGPYCTKLMAGFGADVIKIERPGKGDKMRSMGPFFKNEQGLERSIPFLWLNTGKKSITLNLKTEKGVEIFRKLVRDADAVIENFSPKVMPSLGLSYEALRQINPGIIMTSISNFGQTGPYRDYEAEEIVEYAMSGLMYATGDPDREPLTSGPATTQYTAGQSAYLATLMALYKRGANGIGQHVDVSIQECAMGNGEIRLMSHLNHDTIGKRSKNHPWCPWQSYPCRDGYAVIIGAPMRHWRRVADVVGEPKLASRKFDQMQDRIERRGEVEALLKPWLDAHTGKEIYHAGEARGLAFGYIASLAEVFDSPQHRVRDYFVEIDHPVVGKHRYCGAPFRPSETPWRSERAPLLGEHNESIYCDILGYSKEDLESLAEGGII